MGIEHLLQLEGNDMAFVPLEPPMSIGSFLVWKKYRLRSRACEELIRRLQNSAS